MNKKLNRDEKKQITILSLVVVMTCIILFGTSYAWFVVNSNSQKSNQLIAGNLDLLFDDTDGGEINLKDQLPMSDEEGLQTEGYTFKVKNIGNIEAKYSIFLDDADLASGESRLRDNVVKYSITKNNVVLVTENLYNLKTKILDNDTLAVDKTNTYTLKIWLDETYFDSIDINKVFKKKLRIEASQTQKIGAYTYNEEEGATNYCVTGEEASCKPTNCYRNKESGSCPAGTIIKYKVNDTDVIPFHVMFDDGEKITMQSQRNIVDDGTPWISKEDYLNAGGIESDWHWAYGNGNKGPITALNVLENATKNWKNVNNQTYTVGTTVFKENAYTKCNSTFNCSENFYTLPERTAKVRMITIQELKALGCNNGSTCPIWIFNYLSSNQAVNMDKQDKYMTMSISNLKTNNREYGHHYYVGGNKLVNNGGRAADSEGIRAVVEINK